MGKIEKFKFETLEVYQRTKRLAKRIYLLTEDWPRKYLYDLTSQFRRAILSALLNIAEGNGRGKKEFAHYLDIAIGSYKECVALTDFAAELGLIDTGEREEIYTELSEIVKMLQGLKKSLR